MKEHAEDGSVIPVLRDKSKAAHVNDLARLVHGVEASW